MNGFGSTDRSHIYPRLEDEALCETSYLFGLPRSNKEVLFPSKSQHARNKTLPDPKKRLLCCSLPRWEASVSGRTKTLLSAKRWAASAKDWQPGLLIKRSVMS